MDYSALENLRWYVDQLLEYISYGSPAAAARLLGCISEHELLDLRIQLDKATTTIEDASMQSNS